jgi:hypothetical protein
MTNDDRPRRRSRWAPPKGKPVLLPPPPLPLWPDGPVR